MSVIQVTKDSQNIAGISNLSVKTINKISRKILKSKNHSFNFEEVLHNFINRIPYPNFRFFCPYCASLDVFITVKKTSHDFTVDCLDCKQRWLDTRSWKS